MPGGTVTAQANESESSTETTANQMPTMGENGLPSAPAGGFSGTRPEFGTGAGLALRSALAAADRILNTQKDAA